MGVLSRIGTLLGQLWRLAERLFHVLVGGVFLVLAGAGAAVSFSEWQRYAADASTGLWRFRLLVAFTVLLIVCGLYSFAKARSVR